MHGICKNVTTKQQNEGELNPTENVAVSQKEEMKQVKVLLSSNIMKLIKNKEIEQAKVLLLSNRMGVLNPTEERVADYQKQGDKKKKETSKSATGIQYNRGTLSPAEEL